MQIPQDNRPAPAPIPSRPPIPQTTLLMAAATMHDMGRLTTEPTPMAGPEGHPKDWIGNKNYNDLFEALDKAPAGVPINLKSGPDSTIDNRKAPDFEGLERPMRRV